MLIRDRTQTEVSLWTHEQLRQLAMEYLERHADEYAPFIDLDAYQVSSLHDYCQKMSSATIAEWGGEVELRVLAQVLGRSLVVYHAETDNLVIGSQPLDEHTIRLTFHRCYYALGDHYNSVQLLAS